MDDNLSEGDETIIITLTTSTGATLGTNATHIYTISDNETAPTIQFTTALSSGTESIASTILPITLSLPTSAPVIVQYSISGTAGPADHGLADGMLTFPPLSTSIDLVIPSIMNDSEIEMDETIVITLTAPSFGVLGANATHIYTIMDDDADMRMVTEAVDYSESVAQEIAENRGKDLISVTKKLIKTSVSNLLARSRFTPDTQTSMLGGDPAHITASPASDQQSLSATPINKAMDSLPTSGAISESDRLALMAQSYMRDEKNPYLDAVKLLSVDIDDDSYDMQFDYDLMQPLFNKDDMLITRITAQFSKTDGGPKSHWYSLSVAKEQMLENQRATVGKFIHFIYEKSDFDTDYVGKKEAKSVNLGLYKIYNPNMDMLTSMYASIGLGRTQLDLEKDMVRLGGSYNNYQAQAGMSFSKIYKGKSMTGSLKFGIDALYDYQDGHSMEIQYGPHKFNQLIAGKDIYEVIASIEPRLNIDIMRDDRVNSILRIAPFIKCGAGSYKSDCGGGISTDYLMPFSNEKGHYSYSFLYERFRKRTTFGAEVNINEYLMDNENLQLQTSFGIDDKISDEDSTPYNAKFETGLQVTF